MSRAPACAGPGSKPVSVVSRPASGAGSGCPGSEACRFPYRYLCVLDFEATCEKDIRMEQEIIEFPSVLLRIHDDGSVAVVSEIDLFVRPRLHPLLTAFCTELTGIEQVSVDRGVDIVDALHAHTKWLSEHTGVASAGTAKDVEEALGRKVLVCTCGDWDLKTMLPTQSRRDGFSIPMHLSRWHNVKQGFEGCYSKRAHGMTDMLRHLKIRLEGRHHSGIDDCRNIARIATAMVDSGFTIAPTASGVSKKAR